MSKGKKLVFTLLVVVLALGMFVAGMELFLRLLYAYRLDYHIEMYRYAREVKRPSPDPGIGHEHRPGARARLMGVEVRINSQGWREREIAAAKPPGTYRIMFLGDSLTFGWGVAEEERFSRLVEKALQERGSCRQRVQTINTGVGNYNTCQEVAAFARRGRAFRPDLVVLCYFINDAEPMPSHTSGWLLRHSYLAVWLKGRMDTFLRDLREKADYRTYYRNLYRDDAPGWRRARACMRRLAELSRRDGFRLAAVILPELHSVGRAYQFRDVHRKIAAALRRAGIPHILDATMSLEGQNPPELWVSPDDPHPNARANALFARVITRFLREQGLVPCAPLAPRGGAWQSGDEMIQ